MKNKRNQNQIWLFSFADLAFLLLIAFTQASTVGKKPIIIGEMTLPKVVEGPSVESFSKTAEQYQVRVHKPEEETPGPFQVVAVNARGEENPGPFMGAGKLETTLMSLYHAGQRRPVLVPDEASWSRDMLMAMSLVEKIWTGTRSVTVESVKEIPKDRE